jgi:PAS domain S-box-containing protein
MANGKILIVEDEIVIGMDVMSKLEKLGYKVVDIAASAEDALSKLSELSPDLILVDIFLKGKMDGIDLADKVQKNLNIPVVFLTAYFDQNLIERAKVTSPYGYIIKPFRERELSVIIEIALYKHKMDYELKQKQKELEELNKNLEKKVKERTREILQFKTALEEANYGVIFMDTEDKIFYVNETYAHTLGYQASEMTRKGLFSFYSEEQKKNLLQIRDILRKEESFNSIEVLHTRKDGTTFPMLMNGKVLKDLSGKISFLAITAVDITQRKQMENALRQNEEMFREMADFLPAVVFEFNKNLRLTYINKAGLENFGFNRSEFDRGISILDLFVSDERERFTKQIHSVLKGEAANLKQFHLLKKDGSAINALINTSPIFRNGEVLGVRGTMIDIKPFFLSAILPDDSFFEEYHFTQREKEILILLAQSFKYKEIAEKLFISENTLKTHMSNIYDKMGVNSKYEIFDIIKDFQIKNVSRDRLFFSILSMLLKD